VTKVRASEKKHDNRYRKYYRSLPDVPGRSSPPQPSRNSTVVESWSWSDQPQVMDCSEHREAQKRPATNVHPFAVVGDQSNTERRGRPTGQDITRHRVAESSRHALIESAAAAAADRPTDRPTDRHHPPTHPPRPAALSSPTSRSMTLRRLIA